MKMPSLILTVLMGGGLIPAAAEDSSDPWYRRYETAHAVASERGLPLLLHFYTDWCGPCRRMEQNVLNSEPVLQQLGTNIVGAKINADQESDVAQRFGVSGYPTDVLLSPEGTVLASTSGYASATEYVTLITSHADETRRTEPVAVWDESAESEPKVGLRGFSPVSITRDRTWQKGDSRFAWSHHGVLYHLVDADELSIFQADPDRYVPRLAGYDPLLLATENRRVGGDIQHGAFYQNGLYLHATRENRQRFLTSPERYTAQAEAALTADADTLTLSEPAP